MVLGSFSLSGKIALVTGGGSGISLSWAKIAVSKNARVLIADLKLTREAEAFLQESGSDKVIFVKCDVSKRAELENLIVQSERQFGNVPDVYIAGAGVFEPTWSNFWDDTEEDEYVSVNININHPLKLSRIAIKALLRKRKTGVILIASSLAGYQGTFSAPLYCATKHAIVGFVRSMAMLDSLESIKVVAVAPGLVRTPLWTDYPEKMKQFGYTPETAVGPEAVAEAMIELCTEEKYEGGTCLEVSLKGTRTLGTWNIPEPETAGTSVPKEVIQNFLRPVQVILDSERGVGVNGGSK